MPKGWAISVIKAPIVIVRGVILLPVANTVALESGTVDICSWLLNVLRSNPDTTTLIESPRLKLCAALNLTTIPGLPVPC